MGRRGRRRAPWAVAIALLLFLGAFTVAVARPPANSEVVDAAGSTSVAVTASTGFMFTPNTFNDVGTSTNVTVTFTDGDTLAHSFTISSRQGFVIPTSYSPSQLQTFLTTYPPLASEYLPGPGTMTFSFTAPAVGWYEFVCNQTGHFQSGMYGFIAFGEALPGNLTVTAPYDGPGAAVFIIVGTIVALTVVAIVLGFVVGRRRGSSEEMPPERLGYPEPAPPPGPQRLSDSKPPPS
jgi:plastocyanin